MPSLAMSSPSTTDLQTPTLPGLAIYVTRLYADRKHWRDIALNRKFELAIASQRIKDHDATIANLTSSNACLKSRLKYTGTLAMTSPEKLFPLENQRHSLEVEVQEKDRMIKRLRNSEKAKGNVQQRNLTLKAAFLSMRFKASPQETEANDTLLEALAAATERIAELENAGKGLLNALDRGGDSDAEEGQDGENSDDEELSTTAEAGSELSDDEGLSTTEAEIRFRNVLEDDNFAESKKLWEDLLDG
jgi:hypothetical protein